MRYRCRFFYITIQMMKSRYILSGLIALCSLSTYATDIDFTYNTDNKDYKVYGFEKKEKYDIAILINNPAYVGAKVKGISVPMPVNDPAVTDVTAWISTELKLENKVNAPDICSKSGEVTGESIDITFDSPYEIPVEGVWVGYSFNITDLSDEYGYPKMPIACIESDDNLDKGLWIHTSRSRLKWTNLGESLGAVSAMTVQLSTDFGANDVAISLPAQSYIVSGEDYAIPVTLINHGSNALENVTYSYTIGDKKGTGSLHLDTPLEASGKAAVVGITIEAYEEMGEYPFTLTIDSSNGETNNDPFREGKGTMNVWPLIPVARPLVEEFTGLGCGYCPRGYIAMEEMGRMFGDMFIGLAYHSSSYETAMVTVENRDFPVDVDGFPSSCINRGDIIDPSYLPYRWNGYASEIVPAEITVSADYSADGSEIHATSTVNFVRDEENADYMLSFALVADGLQNPSWLQSNYYSGNETGDGVDSELWDLFLNGASKVGGLVFNDVVAYYKDIKGIEGSIPTSIKRGKPMTFDYSVKMEDVKTVSGKDFLNKDAKLHIVAILLDGKTGRPVNCNKSASLLYSDSASGVRNANITETEVREVIYHNMQGVRLQSPEGICIRTEVMSDGTRRTYKHTH